MTSDHNSSELEFTTTAYDLSSSKWLPSCSSSDKTATSRQDVELLFHHQNNNAESDTLSIHIERMEILPVSSSTALGWWGLARFYMNRNLRIHKDGDGDASFQLKSDSLPHAHAQSTKTFYKHQDSRIMKAQELKTKTSAQTLILKITPQKSSFGGDC
ncbi:hypothetical protein Tco_0819181 [Tanacetum coccineum]|uniref:Uncharacterized protein n=1 Tax=Tanacetum coccineum TaxID=301880 RepID=A0ABQ5A8Q6_9ASTR